MCRRTLVSPSSSSLLAMRLPLAILLFLLPLLAAAHVNFTRLRPRGDTSKRALVEVERMRSSTPPPPRPPAPVAPDFEYYVQLPVPATWAQVSAAIAALEDTALAACRVLTVMQTTTQTSLVVD